VNPGSLPPEAAAFLDRPGLPGPWGALMDEYARAAADLCRVVESLPARVYAAKRPGPDEHTTSPQAIAAHVVGAARRYADYIRKAQGLTYDERFVLPDSEVAQAPALRKHLAAALRYTEQTLDPLRDWPEERVAALSFKVRWGPTYDPEMLLEHAVCHLLRHRRQLQRW
jgi:uncharacterized damage-inducible protein DinB